MSNKEEEIRNEEVRRVGREAQLTERKPGISKRAVLKPQRGNILVTCQAIECVRAPSARHYRIVTFKALDSPLPWGR